MLGVNKMEQKLNRTELANLFVHTSHLNVPQIQSLGPKGFDSEEIIKSISEILLRKGKYPEEFNGEDLFEGCAAEKKENGKYRIIYMSEYSMDMYKIVKEEIVNNVEEAANRVAKTNWGKEFDGIQINWKNENA
jgi:hypothetical protein